jgi:hypothetical protein
MVNVSTGELQTLEGESYFPDGGGTSALSVQYGASGWGAVFVGGIRRKWLREILREILFIEDGEERVRSREDGGITSMADRRWRYLTCYVDQRDTTMTYAKLYIPRAQCIMFWHVRDMQNWLRPVLKQSPETYSMWIGSQWKTWSTQFKAAIADESDGLCEGFIRSQRSHVTQLAYDRRKGREPTVVDPGQDGKDFLEEFAISTCVLLWWLCQIGQTRKAVKAKAMEILEWVLDLAFQRQTFLCYLDPSVAAAAGDCAPQNFEVSDTTIIIEIKNGLIMSLVPIVEKLEKLRAAIKRTSILLSLFFYL